MLSVTASQAQVRLPNERKRRRELRDTISGLEESQRILKRALENVQKRQNVFFTQKLQINNGDWKGRALERFHSNDIETMKHFATDYLTRLERTLATVSQSLKTSNTNLTRINQTIANLERIIATGGI